MSNALWEQLQHADRAAVWHPYAPATGGAEVYPVVSASGVRLQLAEGN